MNAIAPRSSIEAPASNPLIPKTLDEAARLAKIMSDMSLVPQHLQGKPADCMLVIEQAQRWRMSPFAVAQATSVLQGKLNFEGKLVAAALHTSGILASRLRYDYSGEGDGREVLVSAIVIGETEPRDVLVKIKDVRTKNSMWVSQPDQQLAYSGARIWARRHASEVMLGVYAPEEFEPVASPAYTGGPTIEGRPEELPATPNPRPVAKAASARPRDQVNDDGIPALEEPLAADKHADSAARLIARIEACPDQDALDVIAGDQRISDWRAKLGDDRLNRPELAKRIADAFGARFRALDAQPEQVPA